MTSILEVRNIVKEFPGVKALDKVDFLVEKDEIHCLCGENGAGKSTLMKVISGVYQYDEGELIFEGKSVNYKNVRESTDAGITIIYQEFTLIPQLTIFQNIFLGHELRWCFVNDDNLMRKKAVELLVRVGLNESVDTLVGSLGVGKRQLVEIAKALSKEVKLLILDEPTSSLNDEESQNLLDLILRLKKQGITCVMISHKLNEVMYISDTVTILRDGKTISSHKKAGKKVGKKVSGEELISETLIIKKMVGRDLENRFPKRERSNFGKVLLEVKDWSVAHPEDPTKEVIKNVNFKVRQGEVLGISGLMGSGRTELMMSIFGGMYGSRIRGKLLLKNKEMRFRSPKEAISNGVVYVSEDRKNLGLVLVQDVATNISNSSLHLFSNLGVLDQYGLIESAEKYKEALQIKTPSLQTVVNTLSGGNQQKVVLSRCLLTNPNVFIVDEPTRGIDIGAKYEIYTIINDLVKQGKAVIMLSSELPEIMGMVDRLYVMNEGRIKGELENKVGLSQEDIMRLALA